MELELLLDQCKVAISAFWIAASVGCSALVAIWRLWLTTRYLREALGRELRSNSAAQRTLIAHLYSRSRLMQKELLESFLRAPTPTLHDLVESTERELRVRASRPPSVPSNRPLTGAMDEETIQLNTGDFTPHSLGSRATPRNRQ